MRWYDGKKYKPKHGTMIFVWYIGDQKPLLINYFANPQNYNADFNFPIWAYALDGFDPEEI